MQAFEHFMGKLLFASRWLLVPFYLVLLANLLIIIIFAGYENFVSKIETGDHEDRPDWMGSVDFADLKMKLIGSIIAISGIELLRAFFHVGAVSNEEMAWKVGVHDVRIHRSGLCDHG